MRIVVVVLHLHHHERIRHHHQSDQEAEEQEKRVVVMIPLHLPIVVVIPQRRHLRDAEKELHRRRRQRGKNRRRRGGLGRLQSSGMSKGTLIGIPRETAINGIEDHLRSGAEIVVRRVAAKDERLQRRSREAESIDWVEIVAIVRLAIECLVLGRAIVEISRNRFPVNVTISRDRVIVGINRDHRREGEDRDQLSERRVRRWSDVVRDRNRAAEVRLEEAVEGRWRIIEGEEGHREDLHRDDRLREEIDGRRRGTEGRHQEERTWRGIEGGGNLQRGKRSSHKDGECPGLQSVYRG